MLKLSGQSAIEYLMTYGWMLLVVGIAGGTFYSLGGSGDVKRVSGFSSNHVTVHNFGMTGSGDFQVDVDTFGSDVEVEKVVFSQDGKKVVLLGDKASESLIFSSGNFTDSGSRREVKADIHYSKGGLQNIVSSGYLIGNLEINSSYDQSAPSIYLVNSSTDWDQGAYSDSESSLGQLAIASSGTSLGQEWQFNLNSDGESGTIVGDKVVVGTDNDLVGIWSNGSVDFKMSTAGSINDVESDGDYIYTVLNYGTGEAVKRDLKGNPIWTTPLGDYDVEVDSSGDIYVTNYDYWDSKNLIKYNSSGDEQWSYSTSQGENALTTDVNSLGQAYLGTTSGAVEANLRKFDASDGTNTWEKDFYPTALEVDSNNDLIMASVPGRFYDNSGLYKYDSSNSEVWSNPSITSTDDIGLDSDDNIYIGTSSSRFLNVSKSDGSVVWNKSTSGIVEGVAVNSSEEIYLVTKDQDAVTKMTPQDSYYTSASYISESFGAGVQNNWGSLEYNASLNSGSLDLEVQYSNDDFNTVGSRESLSLTDGVSSESLTETSKYIRFNVTASGPGSDTPYLDYVAMRTQ